LNGLIIYCFVVLVLQILSLFMLAENRRTIPSLHPGKYPVPPKEQAPKVSIIIPARNEQENIERCVRSCLAQDYPSLEVIVVDDRSTDRTPEILAAVASGDARLRVIAGLELPPDWLGKNHALWQGVGAADGEFLLFVDADTEIHSSCLTQTIGYAREHGSDLLTIVPRLENVTFWERAIQPAIGQLVLGWFPSKAINDPKKPGVASANGPFLLFHRESYEAIGGHQGVKRDIVEDLTLAKKIKKEGRRLSYLLAPELQRVRMYTGLGEIWRGWSKNVYVGLYRNPLLALFAIAGLLGFFVLPWALPIAAVAVMAVSGYSKSALAVLVLSVLICLVAVLWRKLIAVMYGSGENKGAWFQALGFLVICGIVVNSAYKSIAGKEVSWKGRTSTIESG